MILAPPPPEPAPNEDGLPRPPPPPPAVHDRFEASIGAAIFPAALGNVTFVGSGIPAGSGRRTTFSHRGRELGLRNPTFRGGELALGYRHTYFSVMVSGVIAGNSKADATPTDAATANQVGASNVTAYGGALELYGAIPFGRLTVSAGVVGGFRGYSMPLVGFEPTICTTRGRRGKRSYPCAEQATTKPDPYVQPRLRLDVALDKRHTLFLGAYVGLDALGDRSFLGGAMLGFRIPQIDP